MHVLMKLEVWSSVDKQNTHCEHTFEPPTQGMQNVCMTIYFCMIIFFTLIIVTTYICESWTKKKNPLRPRGCGFAERFKHFFLDSQNK